MVGISEEIANIENDYEGVASLFKALAHPLRLKLVCYLIKHPSTQTQLSKSLDIPQSSTAQHLAVLKRAEVLDGDKQGTEITLSVKDSRVLDIFMALCNKPKS